MNQREQNNKQFVLEWANPHSWLLAADDLHEQALAQYRRRDGSVLMIRKDGETKSSDRVDKSIFLLGGFALENAIKAFLVYENPEWVANGRLSNNLRSHSLTKLQAKSKLIPFKKRYLAVLKGFEAGLELWARYPCALTFERTEQAELDRAGTVGWIHPRDASVWDQTAKPAVKEVLGRAARVLRSMELQRRFSVYGQRSLKWVFRFVAVLAHVAPALAVVEFEAELFCHLQHDVAP